MTPFARRLGCVHPIIQAPMAGGGDTPELVAAVGNAGGIGFIGAAYLTSAQITATARAVRERTAQPFGINLFASPPSQRQHDPTAAIARLAPYYAEIGVEAPTSVPAPFDFDAQLAAAGFAVRRQPTTDNRLFSPAACASAQSRWSARRR